MPHDDADSGDEESDSDHVPAELATVEDFIISEEDRQEAIDRVTFDRCELVREAGERYRDGDSIPVIAAESGKPTMTVEEVVRTYYLVFSKPPGEGVSVREYRSGRRYFADGVDVADLDVETRTEAEEQVRAFMGRTLLENDLDAVDIESPLPEMESLWLDELAMMDEFGVEELADLGEQFSVFQWPSAGLALHPDVMEQARKNVLGVGALMRSNVIRDVQNLADELTRNTIPLLRRSMEPSYSALAAGSVLASSAAMSSMAASMGPGIESAVVQSLNHPGFQEAFRALRTMPWEELTWALDEQLDLVNGIVEQIAGLQPGVAGIGATMAGATVAGPNPTGFDPVRPDQVFERLEETQSPADTIPGTDIAAPEPGQLQRIERSLLEVPHIVYAGGSGVVVVLLSNHFPKHQMEMQVMAYLLLMGIGVYSWRRGDRSF